jgi:exonuclease III
MRGTAMMAKHEYQLTNLARLLTGRAMAATYNSIRIINVYAPSGTAKQTDREIFFNEELPELYYTGAQVYILGGDFNCVLKSADTTGRYTSSRALADTVQGLYLEDACEKIHDGQALRITPQKEPRE